MYCPGVWMPDTSSPVILSFSVLIDHTPRIPYDGPLL